MSSNSEPNSEVASSTRERVEYVMDHLERYLSEWTGITSRDMRCMTEANLRRMRQVQSAMSMASSVHAPQIDEWLEVRHDQSVKSSLEKRMNILEAKLQETRNEVGL